jgi:hypothetical protein
MQQEKNKRKALFREALNNDSGESEDDDYGDYDERKPAAKPTSGNKRAKHT